jgi:hypothetical protein
MSLREVVLVLLSAVCASALASLDEQCRSHPDWSPIFHAYVNLPEPSVLLRIAEWNNFCHTQNNLTSLNTSELARAWANYTSFMPLSACDHQYKSLTQADSTTEDLTVFRLCMDVTQIGVILYALTWLGLHYFFPKVKNGSIVSNTGDHTRRGTQL